MALHSLFSVDKGALQIFYYDDLDVCKPLGSKAKTQGADVDRHLVASRNYLTHLERRHQVVDAERRHLPVIAHDPRSADTSACLMTTFVDRLVVSVVCVCVCL